MGEIFSWVKNIVIYLILNTIIMNLLGNSSYKKYISIVSGMILLLIVISPLLKLLDMEHILDYYLNVNIFQSDISEFRDELRVMEDKQKDAVIAGLKERIRNQVSDMLLESNLYLYDFHVDISDDDGESESGGFGSIRSMSITAGYLEQAKVPVFKVDIGRIEISDIGIGDGGGPSGRYEDSSEQKPPSPEEIQIKNRLSDFYNLEQDNINISIKGE